MADTRVKNSGASPLFQDLEKASLVTLDCETGLRRSCGARVLTQPYRPTRLGRRLLSIATHLEGGSFYSYTLRKILWQNHGVYAGAYSYGEWSRPGAFPRGVSIGRYVSIAANVKVFLRNHPYERLSMHPFFYNRALGYVECDTIKTSKCWIGHDAWVGESAIITPGCSRVGIGAVIGAGAVVTKDVPNFAIMGGNPAKVLKYRFEDSDQARILESRWWEYTLEALIPYMGNLTVPFRHLPSNHPLLNLSGEVSTGNPRRHV